MKSASSGGDKWREMCGRAPTRRSLGLKGSRDEAKVTPLHEDAVSLVERTRTPRGSAAARRCTERRCFADLDSTAMVAVERELSLLVLRAVALVP